MASRGEGQVKSHLVTLCVWDLNSELGGNQL